MQALLKPSKFAMPIAGLDIFALMVLLMLVNRPVFDVGRTPLPELRREEAASARTSLPPGHHVELKKDGSVTFDGKPVSPEDLPELVGKTDDPQSPVYLSLESEHHGQAQALVQTQNEVARGNLLMRVELLTKPVPSESAEDATGKERKDP